MYKLPVIEVTTKFINDAVVGYKFRCECPRDADLVKALFSTSTYVWIQTQMTADIADTTVQYFPDQEVTVYVRNGSPGIDALRFLMCCAPLELYVACESFKPVADYDGKRNQLIIDWSKVSPHELNQLIDGIQSWGDGSSLFTEELREVTRALMQAHDKKVKDQ